ncbi:MAG: hypothetical protein MR304_02610 [Eubacterium sp.]|nr:hypothetical protein [Eubacterium sp.]
MAKKNVIQMKKRFRPNLSLAFFLFLLIIIYIIVLAWGYFAKEHISIYEVNTTDISDDAPLYGFVIRSEEIVNSEESGYINYYFSEGSRIGKGDVAYTADGDGAVSSVLEQIQSERDNSASLTKMREVVASFYSGFNMSNYSDVTKLHYDVKNVVFDMNNGSLYSDLKKALKSSGKDSNFTKVTAKKSGVIAYTMDGYESTRQEDVTKELFDDYGSVVRKQMQKEGSTPAGTPVYKLVTSNDWSIVVKLDESYYSALKDKETVRVTITKDDISFNAQVELFDREGTHFAALSTSRYMERYINDRFLQIEFNLKSASGLKIPNSSVLQKDFYVIPDKAITNGADGIGVVRQTTGKEGKTSHEFISLKKEIRLGDEYYVSASVLQGGDILMDASSGENYIVSNRKKLSGVYYVNEGYCQFRPIEVQYKNKEYTIISDHTENGLSAYDHIVVDPASLQDDDFIE